MKVSEEELQKDKEYFKHKRENAIIRLNRNIEKGNVENIEEAFAGFMRAHKQWLLIDDALIVYKLEHNKNKHK